MENVVEGQDSEFSFGAGATSSGQSTPMESAMDQTTIIGDLRGEDEKLTEAL